MFLSNLELTKEQITQKDFEFQELLLDVEKAEDVRKELRDFFSTASDLDIKKYKYSYWRWYVWLTWERLNILSKDELVVVFSQQIPTALLLNIDVQDSLMWYFVASNFFEGDLEPFYLKIKNTFLESETVVGSWQGKDVTIIELIKEMDSVYSSGDSLAEADFENKLRQIMFSEDELAKKFFIADLEIAKERFVYLVAFFETFTEEKIWFVVDTFLNPGKYQNTNQAEIVPAPNLAPKPIISTTPAAPVAPIIKKVTVAPAVTSFPPREAMPKPAPAQPPTAKPPAQPTAVQVKSQVESQFKKDSEGNFMDISGVMEKLNELSAKYNNSKIADMLYFDEQNGKFKWNI